MTYYIITNALLLLQYGHYNIATPLKDYFQVNRCFIYLSWNYRCPVFTQYLYSSASNVVASKYAALGKCWFGKLAHQYGFVAWRRRAWLNIKRKTMYREHADIRAPKDTSHWWVFYCDKLWLYNAFFGLWPSCSQAVSG